MMRSVFTGERIRGIGLSAVNSIHSEQKDEIKLPILFNFFTIEIK
jgi:hypothetical protein